jgi:hypothetical protein
VRDQPQAARIAHTLRGMISRSTTSLVAPIPLSFRGRPFRNHPHHSNRRALPRNSRRGRRSNFSTPRKPLEGSDAMGKSAQSLMLRIAKYMHTTCAGGCLPAAESECWLG